MSVPRPDDTLHAAAQEADQLIIDRVLRLVQAGRLSLEQAAEIVGMSAPEFELLLHGSATPISRAAREAEPLFITNVSFDSHCVYVRLSHSRELTVPLERLPILRAATPIQRHGWQIVGHGGGLVWPDLKLSMSLTSLLHAMHDSDCRCEQQIRDATG